MMVNETEEKIDRLVRHLDYGFDARAELVVLHEKSRFACLSSNIPVLINRYGGN